MCRARRKQSVLDRERAKVRESLKKKKSRTGSDAFSYCTYCYFKKKKEKKSSKRLLTILYFNHENPHT